MTPAPSNALVVGSDGYLGRHVTLALQSSGCRVTRAERSPVDETTRTWDITNPSHVPDDLGSFDTIYFFAGLTGTGNSFPRAAEFVAANETGLLNTLNAMAELPNAPRIIFPSTRLVYKGQKDIALPEDAPKETLTPYAATKLNGERFLDMYAHRYGLSYTVFRICVPYGDATQEAANAYGTLRHFLEPARAGNPILLFGDGTQKRSLIHAEDLATNLIRASVAEETRNRIFNLGGPDVLSVREIAESIASRFGVAVNAVAWPEEALRLESGDTIFCEDALNRIVPLTFSHRFSEWVSGLRTL